MKRSRLILLVFLLVLCIGPSIFTMTYSHIATEPNISKDFSIASDWYNEAWHYRKNVLMGAGTDGAGTDYQVKVEVDYDSGMQADFDDVIFTDDDNVTLLPFWRETYIASTNATFWVKVSDSQQWGTWVTFKMYFGNDAASTTSNGGNTFPLLYEDWSGQSVNPAVWTTVVNDGSISWSITDANHGYVAKIEGGTGTDRQYYNSIAHGEDPTALIFRAKLEKTVGADQFVRIGSTSTSVFGYAVVESSAGTQQFNVYDDDSNADIQAMDDSHFDSYYSFDITRDGTNTKLYVDGVLDETASWAPDAVDQVYATMQVRDSEYDLYVDWICVRKFVTAGPEVASFGEKEYLFPPAWNEAGKAELIFSVPVDETGLNILLIFLGLCIIPVSVLYLVKGGKSGMSSDKLFYGLIAFVMGWALFLGGIL